MVKELVFKDDGLKKDIEEMKRAIKSILNSRDVKFVGIEFHFLVDDEIQVKKGMFAEGYDPTEFEEVDSDE